MKICSLSIHKIKGLGIIKKTNENLNLEYRKTQKSKSINY